MKLSYDSVFVWADNKKYEGQWKLSKKHGEGTMIFQDGKKYNGEYVNDKRHGMGTLEWRKQIQYVAIFQGQPMAENMQGNGKAGSKVELVITPTNKERSGKANGSMAKDLDGSMRIMHDLLIENEEFYIPADRKK